jgi:hypothetical protein
MVATDWAPVIQTGIGALAALGGGFVGAWLQSKSQERIEQRRLHREQAVERQQRRDRAASLLAEVSSLLRDSKDQWVLADTLSLKPPQVEKSLRSNYHRLEDRHEAARERLLAMTISEPSPEVRRQVRELEEALDNSLRSTFYRVMSRPNGKLEIPVLDQLAESGMEEHLKALRLLDDLVEAL